MGGLLNILKQILGNQGGIQSPGLGGVGTPGINPNAPLPGIGGQPTGIPSIGDVLGSPSVARTSQQAPQTPPLGPATPPGGTPPIVPPQPGQQPQGLLAALAPLLQMGTTLGLTQGNPIARGAAFRTQREREEQERQAAIERERLGLEGRRVAEGEAAGRATREQAVKQTTIDNLNIKLKQLQVDEKAFATAKAKLERRAISAARQEKPLTIEELGPGIQAVYTQDDVDTFLASAKADLTQTGMSNKTAKLELEKLTTETALKNLELKQELSQSGLSSDQIQDALSLSTKYEQASKSFFAVREAFNRVSVAKENPTAASDLALVFGFMKLLDPESVVVRLYQKPAD